MSTKAWEEVGVVLFDWNGTLVDDVERASQALEFVLSRHNLPPVGLDGFRSGFRLPLSQWFLTLGFDDSDLSLAEAAWNREMRSRSVALQPGARELLTRLVDAGRDVGVVSAASTVSVMADLRETELARLVDLVVADSVDKVSALVDIVDGSERVGVYVGDVEYDIEAGREAGLLTVAFTGGYRPRAALEGVRPDAVVDSLEEVGVLLGLVD